jgi:DNA-binding transcriptional regulator GbsR (MarR family)
MVKNEQFNIKNPEYEKGYRHGYMEAQNKFSEFISKHFQTLCTTKIVIDKEELKNIVMKQGE